MVIVVPKTWTPSQERKAQEAPDKTKGRTAGGWVHDIAALKKVILLCSGCTHKFNPGRVGYRREKEYPVAQGKCDGCSTFDPRCSWYLPEDTYTDVRSTTDDRRTLQRSRERRIKRGTLNEPA